jgi:hypothetical protein
MNELDTPTRVRRDRILRVLFPVLTLILGGVLWHAVVKVNDIPPYVLPSPGLVWSTLIADWPVLWESLLVTLDTTLQGLALALIGGVGLAVLFNQSRLIEYSFYPYAVILQVTPISSRSSRCSPTPRSGSTRSTTICATCSGSPARRTHRCCSASSCPPPCPTCWKA